MPRKMKTKAEIESELLKLAQERAHRNSYSGPSVDPPGGFHIASSMQTLLWVLGARNCPAPSKRRVES